MHMIAPLSTRLRVVVWTASGLVVGLGAMPQGQSSPAVTTPDEDFAKRVAEWTTRPDFTSPLVTHLPLRKGVPTPKDVLGYHIGEPKRLTSTADQQRYFK